MGKDVEVLNYKKLVVPSTMRSIYWKCYGFPANEEGEILTKSKIVCALCKTVIAYNRNTSNLRTHLINKHCQYLQDLEGANFYTGTALKKSSVNEETAKRPRRKNKKKEKDPDKTKKHLYCANFEGTVGLEKRRRLSNVLDEEDADHSANSNHDHETAEEVETINNTVHEVTYLLNNSLETDINKSKESNAVIEFIISDLQLPDILEAVGFQRMLASLQSPCLIPSKDRFIQENLPLLYRTYKEALKTSISSCSLFSLTVEEWQSDVCGKNFTLSVNFLDKSPEEGLKRRVLSTVHSSLIGDCKTCSDTFDEILQDFGVNSENIRAVVCGTDDAIIMSYLTVRRYTVVPCLIATFQKIFTTECFSMPSVNDILVKTRAVLGHIFKSSKASGSLQIQDELLQLDETQLTSDYPEVWLSTYTMLEELLKRRAIIKNVIEALSLSDEEKLLLNFSDNEWSIITDVVEVLEPFKVVMATLAEENSPLVSIIKPLLNELLNVRLKVSKSDSDLTVTLKNTISSSLKDVYSGKPVEKLLKISTSLDPRLKSMVLPDDKETITNIKEELFKVMGEIGSSNEDQEAAVAKKPKLSGMEMLLRNVCIKNQPLSKSDRSDIEMMQYENEPAASLEVCPLSWWQYSSVKYPYLSLLAKDYNSIPATVLPQSWIPVEKNVAFHIKRARLPLELVDPILFLHSNYTID